MFTLRVKQLHVVVHSYRYFEFSRKKEACLCTVFKFDKLNEQSNLHIACFTLYYLTVGICLLSSERG